MAMHRESVHVIATIAAGAALSDAIDLGRFTGGFIFVPSAWTAADLGFHINYVDGGAGVGSIPFVEALSVTGSLVDITSVVAGKAYLIPPELFGATYFKVWSQSAGSGVNQVSERELHLVLKS